MCQPLRNKKLKSVKCEKQVKYPRELSQLTGPVPEKSPKLEKSVHLPTKKSLFLVFFRDFSIFKISLVRDRNYFCCNFFWKFERQCDVVFPQCFTVYVSCFRTDIVTFLKTQEKRFWILSRKSQKSLKSQKQKCRPKIENRRRTKERHSFEVTNM